MDKILIGVNAIAQAKSNWFADASVPQKLWEEQALRFEDVISKEDQAILLEQLGKFVEANTEEQIFIKFNDYLIEQMQKLVAQMKEKLNG